MRLGIAHRTALGIVTAVGIPAYAGQVAFIVEHPRTSIEGGLMVALSLAFLIGLALSSWWFRSPESLPLASELRTRSGTVSEASATATDVVFKLRGASEEYRYAGPKREEVRAALYLGASVSILSESAEDAIASGRKIRGIFATVYGIEADDKPVVSYLDQRRHHNRVAGLLAVLAALPLVALVYSWRWMIRLRKEERYRGERGWS